MSDETTGGAGLTDAQLAGMRRRHGEFLASLDNDQESGLGDQEWASLYQLNLVAHMGEAYVGRLLDEVERLRAALAEAERARAADAAVLASFNPYPVKVFTELTAAEEAEILAAIRGTTVRHATDRVYASWGRRVLANLRAATTTEEDAGDGD